MPKMPTYPRDHRGTKKGRSSRTTPAWVQALELRDLGHIVSPGWELKIGALKPGDSVKVLMKSDGQEVWKDGIVSKFLGPIHIQVDWTKVNGERCIVPQFPVRFRMGENGPHLMKRFYPWDIQIVEKGDESTQPK